MHRESHALTSQHSMPPANLATPLTWTHSYIVNEWQIVIHQNKSSMLTIGIQGQILPPESMMTTLIVSHGHSTITGLTVGNRCSELLNHEVGMAQFAADTYLLDDERVFHMWRLATLLTYLVILGMVDWRHINWSKLWIGHFSLVPVQPQPK